MMKKILIALDADGVINKINKTGKYKVYDKDITYQEGVLEYLSKNDVDVIVTKDSLER